MKVKKWRKSGGNVTNEDDRGLEKGNKVRNEQR